MADTVETELASVNALAAAAPSSASLARQSTAPEAKKDAADPIFPPLHNNAGADADSIVSGVSAPSRAGDAAPADDNDEDEPAVARPFHRTSTPDPAARPGLGRTMDDDDDDDDDDEQQQHARGRAARRPRLKQQMHRFSLYETASRFYIVGGDVTEKRYRILKIDRTNNDDASELSITDDKTVYTQKDMNQLLDTIDDGNRGTGGLRLRCTTWGLLGFIKFTGPYYMLLITKKSTVAMIGGHYVYQIDGTDLIPLTTPSFKMDQRNTEESRFLAILNNLDLTRSFYYSYSYDITRTLQHNITRERAALLDGRPSPADDDFNPMFVWNHHLLQPAARVLGAPFDWCRPIIHGYIDQAAVSVYGRTAHITIIARRSRYFAGARFLKRGANDLGYVANDVETEQIVSEAMTTSFHAPGPKFFANPTYTSYVQHRGSIPLYWTQDNTGVTPKPPIELNLVDPFYTAAALHFDNLFERYGAPIYVLNLVKARERTPRESKLLDEYTRAIAYLNQFLPADKKIIHRAWDMSRAAKSRDQDVIGTLESIAEDVLRTTSFFQNGDGHTTPIRVQNGVARTNCIDCLDRTNAAQFVIGKRALGHQLHALGILGDTTIEYDTDAVNLFTHMYHDHGDTIAVQYGGSQLVNTMETYRKINQWTSHSRDMIESFKRYYNNSFLDGQRQEAYNLFLGNYIFAQGQPMLWDLATDYYLHHEDPRTWLEKRKRDYIHWYTPAFLDERSLPRYPPIKPATAGKPISAYDDYWLEYYRPSTLSSFPKMFPYKMNSTIKYIPFKSTQDGRYDLSPFRVRTEGDGDVQDRRKAAKKDVTIVAPQDLARIADDTETSSVSENPTDGNGNGNGNGARGTRALTLPRWLHEKQITSGTSSYHRLDHNHQYQYRHQPHQPGITIDSVPSSPFTNGGHRRNASTDDSAMAAAHHHNDHDLYPHHHHHHHHHHHQQHLTGAPGSGSDVNNNNRTPQPHQQPQKPHHHQTALEKSRAAQWTFAQMVHDSLNPNVSAAEAADYARYVAHPHNLPLVVSERATSSSEEVIMAATAAPAAATAGGGGGGGEEGDKEEIVVVEPEYREFVAGRWREDGLGVDCGRDCCNNYNNHSNGSGNKEGNGSSAVGDGDGDGGGGCAGGLGRSGNGNGCRFRGGICGGAGVWNDEDRALYVDTVRIAENPLTVTEEDALKKRYKAYRKWLRGKSLFKQQPVD